MNESNNEVSTDLAPQGLSRRTMIAATAWTVPAVIVATSTPAMAASPGVVSFTGVACKHAGRSECALEFRVPLRRSWSKNPTTDVVHGDHQRAS